MDIEKSAEELTGMELDQAIDDGGYRITPTETAWAWSLVVDGILRGYGYAFQTWESAREACKRDYLQRNTRPAAPPVIAEVETAEAGQSDENPAFRRIPRSPLCAKAGLWPYPCLGRIELQKGGSMKGSFLCEEHGSQAPLTSYASAKSEEQSAELLPCPWCGSRGELSGLVDHSGVMAFCPNDECFLQPETGYFSEKLDAISKWNKRSASAVPAQGDGELPPHIHLGEAPPLSSFAEVRQERDLARRYLKTQTAKVSQYNERIAELTIELDECCKTNAESDARWAKAETELTAVRERISELEKVIEGLRCASDNVRAMLRGNKDMQNREYVDMGIQLNQSIDKADAALRTYAAAKGEGNG